jgi:hypothetical protein
MINNKTMLILTLTLMAGILLVGCGTQASAESIATEALPTQPQPDPVQQETQSDATDSTDSSAEVQVEPEVEPTAQAVTELTVEAPVANTAVSFANDVLPILQSRCIKCHGGDKIEEGLLMRTYEEIMAGSDNGPIVVPGDVANSLMVELVAANEMPKRGPKLSPPQVQIITEWVAAGAPNN